MKAFMKFLVIIGIFIVGLVGGIAVFLVFSFLSALIFENIEFLLIIGNLTGIITGLITAYKISKRMSKALEPSDGSAERITADKHIGNNFNIMVIGQEAVGKTTLLALMYKHFTKNNSFPFVASNDTGITLDEAYQKLSKIIQEPNFIEPPRLLAGTAGVVNYEFELQNRKITACDTAGGLIMTSDGKDFEDFTNSLSKAPVIINVIDGAAMIEGSDFLADKVNSPSRIRDLLLRYKKSESCLVIFVITKCEAWLKKQKDTDMLQKAFETRHQAVLNWVRNNPNCLGIYLPVKTLGCVEFSYIDGKGSHKERMIFHKKTNLQFVQEHVDKPMMYGIQYLTQQTIGPIEKNFKLYGNLNLIHSK